MKQFLFLMICGFFLTGSMACNNYGSGGGGGSVNTALTASGSGASENNEGVDHFSQGHYDVAKEHFQKALAENPNLAEAHYNMALVFDAQGDHTQATAEFKKAAELAPKNPKITQSEILMKHTGQGTPAEPPMQKG